MFRRLNIPQALRTNYCRRLVPVLLNFLYHAILLWRIYYPMPLLQNLDSKSLKLIGTEISSSVDQSPVTIQLYSQVLYELASTVTTPQF